MREVIQECTRLVLQMVEWGTNESGSYVEEGALGESPLVSLSEENYAKIRKLEPTPGQVTELGEEGDSVALGRYFAMAPRGRIELYWERIGSFFWHIAADMLSDHKITAYQLSRLAEAAVAKTALHEMFHHQADVFRVLFGNRRRFPDKKEAAFAVAASYHEVKNVGGGWHGWITVPETLQTEFLERAYRYGALGYRDWVKYKDAKEHYARKFEFLLRPAAFRKLRLASDPPHTGLKPFYWCGPSPLYHSSDFVDIVLLPIAKTRASIKRATRKAAV